MNAEKLYYFAKELNDALSKFDIAGHIKMIIDILEKFNKEIDANSNKVNNKFNEDAAKYDTYQVLFKILNHIEAASSIYKLSYLAGKVKEVYVSGNELDDFFSFNDENDEKIEKQALPVSNFIGLNLKDKLSTIIDNLSFKYMRHRKDDFRVRKFIRLFAQCN